MLAQIVEKIIEKQEKIIGPIALEQAKKVDGLFIDWDTHKITFTGDEKKIVETLVRKYESLFGRASIEVCKEALESIPDKSSINNLPEILKA